MANANVNQHSANSLAGVQSEVHEVKGMVKDVLLAVNDFASRTEERFNQVDNRLGRVESRIGQVEEIMATKSDLAKLETRLVTKDYLDDKLADLRGDLVVLTRKEDTKLKTLAGVLAEKKVIDGKDVKKIYAMEPFAQ